MIVRGRDREFEETAVRAFGFIASNAKPKVTRSDYDAEQFGDAVVELEGDKLKVRVVRDRGQVMADLAPLGCPDWFDEDVVLQSVGVADAKALEVISSRTVEQAAEAIAARFSAIVQSFDNANWKATEADLNARKDRRGEELMARLFPGRTH
jgi:hypothetical protein